MKEGCIFCLDNGLIVPNIVLENDLAFAKWDDYPITPGHTLIIPRQHRDNYLEVTAEESAAIHELAVRASEVLDNHYHPEGYNIFTNVGRAAGQAVMHAHVHLVPRFADDTLVIRLGDHDTPDRAH